MVTVYGMNAKLGNISFYESKPSEYNFNKPYSDATAETIDAEVRKIIQSAYDRVTQLLIDKKDQLEVVAGELLEKEIIFQTDLERLIGRRPFEKQTTYQAFTDGIKSKPQVVPDATTLEEKMSHEGQSESDTENHNSKPSGHETPEEEVTNEEKK